MPARERVEILPALMPDSFEHLGALAATVSAFAPSAQIDIMDGEFVPSVSWPYSEHAQLAEVGRVRLPRWEHIAYEVHLMVADPRDAGTLFARAGARRILGHIETLGHVNDALETFRQWRDAGAHEVGASLLLDTPVSELHGLMDAIEVVQVMSIARVGYQGNPFDERAIDRIRALRAQYPHIDIAVDGGVSEENAAALVRAGANRLSVGSAIMRAKDPASAYVALRDSVAHATLA